MAVNLKDIKDSTMDQIAVATMGDSDKLKVGEPAIAIGNALGYGQSVTTGIISAKDRTMEGHEGTCCRQMRPSIPETAAARF